MRNIFIIVMLFSLFKCTPSNKLILNSNPKFIEQLDYYISTKPCGNESDDFYVIISNIKSDTIDIRLAVYSGSYIFLNESAKIKDFFIYKDFNIMLYGDYPNDIIQIEQNIDSLDIIKILEAKYPEDLKKYTKNPFSVHPPVGDSRELYLTFKKDSLISVEKNWMWGDE